MDQAKPRPTGRTEAMDGLSAGARARVRVEVRFMVALEARVEIQYQP